MEMLKMDTYEEESIRWFVQDFFRKQLFIVREQVASWVKTRRRKVSGDSRIS